MKMFNRTTYDKDTINLIDYIENPSVKYKRRMSGNNRVPGTGLKRGFSGFHEPEAVSSVNKIKEFNQIYVAPLNPSKSILSTFKKREDKPLKLNFLNSNKNSFRQTAAGFMTKQREKGEQRFCQTAVNGFGLHIRPMSKQQPRINKSNIKDMDRQRETQEVSFDVDDADSNVQDMDEEDREMVRNIQKLSNQTDYIHKQQRPQTSKGFRKKMASSSDLEVDTGRNLLQQLKVSSIGKGDFQFEQPKIPIRNMYGQRKKGHPSSAHPKNNQRASKQFQQLFKISTITPKKNSVEMSGPFQSLIGSQFLSLFANGRN